MEGGPAGFRPGFTCPTLLGYLFERALVFRLRGYHPLWRSFPEASARLDLCNFRRRPGSRAEIPRHPMHNGLALHARGLGCVPFARRYWGHRWFFLFLGLLRCFNSPRSLPSTMNSSTDHAESTRAAFPHSEIPGSQVVSSSPGLIAADHVLHRLSVPRHPPHTLTSLTTEIGFVVTSRRRYVVLGRPRRAAGARDLVLWFLVRNPLFRCQRSSRSRCASATKSGRRAVPRVADPLRGRRDWARRASGPVEEPEDGPGH